MTSAHAGFGRLVVTLRWPLVIFWVAAAIVTTLALPSIEESQNGALGDLVPNESAALDAELRSNRLFGFPVLSRTVVVKRDAAGLSPLAQASTVERAVALNRDTLPELERIGGAIPVLNTVAVPPFTREQGTTAVTYLLFGLDTGPGAQLDLAEQLAGRAQATDPGSFTGVTGALAAREAQSRLIADALPLVELCTVLLVVLAIGLHYRALLAPLVTLAAIAVAYLITVRVVAWVGQSVDVSVPSEVQPVIVVLLFGVLTDYAIFFLSRFRLRLAEGAPAHDAARAAAGELVGTIVAAGVTVAAASAALLVAELGFFQTFGPGWRSRSCSVSSSPSPSSLRCSRSAATACSGPRARDATCPPRSATRSVRTRRRTGPSARARCGSRAGGPCSPCWAPACCCSRRPRVCCGSTSARR